MSTDVVTLEPANISAAVQSLKAEFANANLAGVETTARGRTVHVRMPIARLSTDRFACESEHVSWRTREREIVIQAKGFAIEQHTDGKAFHLVFKTRPAAGEKANPVRRIFLQRSLRAIEQLQGLEESKLAEAVQAPTDYSVLISALKSEEALASLRAADPLAGARVRGLEAKRRLLEAEGGAVSSAEAARLLGITRQAVDKRRKEGKLLGVELGRKGFRYPAWQFGLSHFEPVLAALRGRDSWEQITFFLNPSPLLEDRTPLEALQQGKCEIGDLLRAASVFGEQGA